MEDEKRQVLQAKEARFSEVKALWSWGFPLVITSALNLPGGASAYPFSEDLAEAMWFSLRRELRAKHIPYHAGTQTVDAQGPFMALGITEDTNWFDGSSEATGLEGMAMSLKRLLVQIEETHPLGRLFDLDVLLRSKGPISRQDLGLSLRECLVCTLPAHLCRRSGNHSLEDLKAEVMSIVGACDPGTIARFSCSGIPVTPLASAIGQKAVLGMLLEAAMWPSPGLVSPMGQGGHRDMNYTTFLVSSSVLSSCFTILAALGEEAGSKGTIDALMAKLRAIGYIYEEDMLRATGGINTHRGLLFTMGLVSGAAGYLGYGKDPPCALGAKDIAETLAKISQDIVQIDFLSTNKVSARAKTLFEKEGFTGPRGQAQRGLPEVVSLGLPALEKAISKGYSVNDSLVQTLISLVSVVEDTALAGRHGVKVLRDVVQPLAKRVLDLGGIYTQEGRRQILELQKEFDQKGINPGGSADLTAVTCTLYLLTHGFFPASSCAKPSVFWPLCDTQTSV